jgi:anti-sigma factor RsiW
MKECVEEGILQSYFDGELSLEMMERVGTHLTSCLACKRAARELESESLLLSEALEPEFAMSVPTERLRHRIEAAIAERRLLNPPRPGLASAGAAVPLVRRWAQSIADLFALSPQRAFGYAGLAAVVLFAITFALVRFRTVTPVESPQVAAIAQPSPTLIPTATPDKAVAVVTGPSQQNVKSGPTYTPVVHRPNRAITGPVNPGTESAHAKLLPGERSYIKTIAALDTSMKSNQAAPMRPALQSEYERNLAMLDRAIAATRNAAKSNPNDPDAAEFMFAAYQTKVDFLNQVADSRLSNRQH